MWRLSSTYLYLSCTLSLCNAFSCVSVNINVSELSEHENHLPAYSSKVRRCRSRLVFDKCLQSFGIRVTKLNNMTISQTPQFSCSHLVVVDAPGPLELQALLACALPHNLTNSTTLLCTKAYETSCCVVSVRYFLSEKPFSCMLCFELIYGIMVCGKICRREIISHTMSVKFAHSWVSTHCSYNDNLTH